MLLAQGWAYPRFVVVVSISQELTRNVSRKGGTPVAVNYPTVKCRQNAYTWGMVIRRIKAELRRQGFTGNKSTIKGDPVRKKQRQQIAGMLTLVPVASLSNPDLVRVDNGILTPARTTLNRSQGNLADRAGCCLLYTSPSPRDQRGSRMPSSA